jgi:hypothetical protein
MIEVLPSLLIAAAIFCLIFALQIHSRRIDRVHERIGLTTKLNGLKDPWRESEERAALQHSSQKCDGGNP